MKLTKILLSLFLIIPTFLGSITYVSGEDYVTDGCYVEFKDQEMTQNFTQEDIDEVGTDLQPGDTWTIRLKVINTTGNEDWYMTNEVLKTYETKRDDGRDANPGLTEADNGAYTYKLTYYDNENWQNETNPRVIYDSEVVGGDETDGLHQATSALENYFYLDSLAPGESGLLLLEITLDGETLNNDYQNTSAVVQMNFACEDRTIDTSQDIVTTSVTSTIKTGDNSSLLIYGLLSGASLMFMIGLLYLYRRQKNEERRNSNNA